MNNLRDWSLSSCISNWNDLETHSTRSRPVYSLQTSIRRIDWSARQKRHWGRVEGLLQHAHPWTVHVSTPASDALLSSWQQQHAGPARTTASLMSDAANQLSDKQHFPICLHPSFQQPQWDPCQTENMLGNITYLGLYLTLFGLRFFFFYSSNTLN